MCDCDLSIDPEHPHPIQALAGNQATDLAIFEWAERAGVLYETAEGGIAFALHRYKELYLAELWKSEYEETGSWPSDLRDRIGRILWNEAVMLFAELTARPREFCSFLYSFAHERTTELKNDSDLIERYRGIETLIFLGRFASTIHGDSARTLYYDSLYLFQWCLLKGKLTVRPRRAPS